MKVRVMLVREGRSEAKVDASTPERAYRFLKPKARRLGREHVWRIDLDARNQIIGYEVVSVGTLTASLIHPREVFVGALLSSSAGVIIAHNHPSGDPAPSPEDREVTRRIVESGKILGVPMVDHLIIGDGTYFSFREAGLL